MNFASGAATKRIPTNVKRMNDPCHGRLAPERMFGRGAGNGTRCRYPAEQRTSPDSPTPCAINSTLELCCATHPIGHHCGADSQRPPTSRP